MAHRALIRCKTSKLLNCLADSMAQDERRLKRYQDVMDLWIKTLEIRHVLV